MEEQHRVLTPEVMMTDWKRSNTGLMAKEASIQLWDNRGHKGRGWGQGLSHPQGCISPEVQNGVGNGGGPVVKGLNDNGEAWWRGGRRVSLGHSTPALLRHPRHSPSRCRTAPACTASCANAQVQKQSELWLHTQSCR